MLSSGAVVALVRRGAGGAGVSHSLAGAGAEFADGADVAARSVAVRRRAAGDAVAAQHGDDVDDDHDHDDVDDADGRRWAAANAAHADVRLRGALRGCALPRVVDAASARSVSALMPHVGTLTATPATASTTTTTLTTTAALPSIASWHDFFVHCQLPDDVGAFTVCLRALARINAARSARVRGGVRRECARVGAAV